jgi:hypothetical protein
MVFDVVVFDTSTNILVEPGISIFWLIRKELSYPEGGGGGAGSSKLFGAVYQTSWSHIP